jgi:hypothetical protein
MRLRILGYGKAIDMPQRVLERSIYPAHQHDGMTVHDKSP